MTALSDNPMSSPTAFLVQPAPVTRRQIWLNLGGLGMLVALLGLAWATGGAGVTSLIPLDRLGLPSIICASEQQ